VVISEACSSLSLVHPSTASFDFFSFLVFLSLFCSSSSHLRGDVVDRHRVACRVSAVGFLYSDAQRAQGMYPCGVGEALVSSVGLGVQSLQSTRVQSTHPPWVVYTEVVAGCFF
jgi:hypothetical protein